MKRFFVSTLGLLALTGPAVAVQTVTVGRTDGTYYRPGGAGEYQLTLHGDPVPGLVMESPFQSFSVEIGAEIHAIPGTTYDVAVSDHVTSSGDALTPEAAYLYHSFVKGTLVTNYDYARGLGRETSARVLQAAMWSVQGESGSLLDLLNANPEWHPVNSGSLEYAWANEFIAESQSSEWTSIGDVRVLNLSSWAEGEEPADNQDMLVLLVPAPGAVALGAFGLGMLGWFRRRRGV